MKIDTKIQVFFRCKLGKFRKTRACRRVPLDAYRWTPKGETNGLSTLYVQKAYEFDVGDTVSVFCGRRVKISIIHNYNLTENFGAVGINFRLGGVNLPKSGGGEVKFRIFHNNNVTEKIANVGLSIGLDF